VKRGKTCAVDAWATSKTVTRPTLRFVPAKPTGRQAALPDHEAGHVPGRQRPRILNAVRAQLGGLGAVRGDVPPAAVPPLDILAGHLRGTGARMQKVTARIGEMQTAGGPPRMHTVHPGTVAKTKTLLDMPAIISRSKMTRDAGMAGFLKLPCGKRAHDECFRRADRVTANQRKSEVSQHRHDGSANPKTLTLLQTASTTP